MPQIWTVTRGLLFVFPALLLCSFTAFPQTNVYVDLVYPGVETGTPGQPFDTLGEARGAVSPGGTIHIDSDDSHEVPTINQAVTLRTAGGPVRIGVLSSILGSGAPLEWLRITEIMYNPGDGGAEFLELQNTGPAALDISGVFFSDGIDFTFPASTVLASGEYIVLVRSTDLGEFSDNYPLVTIGGVYTGALNNGGEGVALPLHERVLHVHHPEGVRGAEEDPTRGRESPDSFPNPTATRPGVSGSGGSEGSGGSSTSPS